MALNRTKNRKEVEEKFDKTKAYSLEEAAKLVKEVTFTNFDASLDLSIRLNVDPKQADQNVRGTATLPHGSGKEVKVLALCSPDKQEEAKKAGADHVGLEEYIEKIEKGWTDIDVVVATPDVMPKIGKLGKVLGPRNLMPNPKSGTVAEQIGEVVEEVKKGKISFRVDKYGIIHTTIGRSSFTAEQIYENARELLQKLAQLRPASTKGFFFKSIYISSSMSPSIEVDRKSVNTV